MTCSYSVDTGGSHSALLSPAPTTSVPAEVTIGHGQLRDLIVCPKDRGVVWYISRKTIVEHDISNPDHIPHVLAHLPFKPVALCALAIDEDRVLLAAGGQAAEIYLAAFCYMSRNVQTTPPSAHPLKSKAMIYSAKIWDYHSFLPGSINNSVVLYLPPPVPVDRPQARSHEKPAPRLVVSNNDCTVKFFDVSLERDVLPERPADHQPLRRVARRRPGEPERDQRLQAVGLLKLGVPINHTSISPDGRTILSCGDSPSIYLHRLSRSAAGTALSIEHVATYTLPPSRLSSPSPSPWNQYVHVNGSSVAESYPVSSCFSTSWSSDGSKFAVASQEGMVAVWDVRSKYPLATCQWETLRGMERLRMSRNLWENEGVGILHDAGIYRRERAPSDLSRPFVSPTFEGASQTWPAGVPWGVRSVRFVKNSGGRELLIFSEHTSLVHAIDAETFERHEVIRVPDVQADSDRRERALLRSVYDLPSPPPSTGALDSSQSTSQLPRSFSPGRFVPESPEILSRLPSPCPSLPISPPSSPPPQRRGSINDTERIRRGQASSPPSVRPPITNGMSDIHQYEDADDEDDDGDPGVITIPRLPDGVSEDEVRLVMARHGFHTVTVSNERALSAADGSGTRRTRGHALGATRRGNVDGDVAGMDVEAGRIGPEIQGELSRIVSSSTQGSISDQSTDFHPCKTCYLREVERDRQLDIAGIAFDPSGDYMYVASVGGVTEWEMKGGGMRWWCEGGWA